MSLAERTLDWVKKQPASKLYLSWQMQERYDAIGVLMGRDFIALGTDWQVPTDYHPKVQSPVVYPFPEEKPTQPERDGSVESKDGHTLLGFRQMYPRRNEWTLIL